MLTQAFQALDIFSNKVQLNVKNSDKYQTNAGTLMTIVVLGITFIQAITTLSGIFQYSAPQVTSVREYNKYPGTLGLNSSNFIFGVKIIDPFYNLSEAYVSFTLNLYSITRDDKSGNVSFGGGPVPMKKCTLEYLKGFEEDYYQYGFDTALCPDSDNYDVNGTYLTDNFTFFTLRAYPC